jgi:DNA-binding LacI/PurR family transcriptional regulator
MSSVKHVTALLERRIQYGDYVTKQLPAEEALAKEAGVSRMTARKAVLRLLERGVLIRSENGRLAVAAEPSVDGRLLGVQQVVLLKPASSSPSIAGWVRDVQRAGAPLGVRTRPTEFVHWEDPVVGDVLEAGRQGRICGLFVLPSAEPLPAHVVQRLAEASFPVVMLWRDLSAHGIRCVDTTPPELFRDLFVHLYAQGYRRVDCFNTQPREELLERRIQVWSQWREACGDVEGDVLDRAVVCYGDAMKRAYDLGRALVRRGRVSRGQAIWCTTSAAALGLTRALGEAGLRVGTDVAVAGADDEGFARYVTPTLTTLRPADPLPYLRKCAEWMATGGRNWTGPLLLRPAHVELFRGQSTAGRPAVGKPG